MTDRIKGLLLDMDDIKYRIRSSGYIPVVLFCCLNQRRIEVG